MFDDIMKDGHLFLSMYDNFYERKSEGKYYELRANMCERIVHEFGVSYEKLSKYLDDYSFGQRYKQSYMYAEAKYIYIKLIIHHVLVTKNIVISDSQQKFINDYKKLYPGSYYDIVTYYDTEKVKSLYESLI